jgi:hypothetical protein
MRGRLGGTVRARVHTFDDGMPSAYRDRLATEEPLEIALAAAPRSMSDADSPIRTVAMTMRAPAADVEPRRRGQAALPDGPLVRAGRGRRCNIYAGRDRVVAPATIRQGA